MKQKMKEEQWGIREGLQITLVANIIRERGCFNNEHLCISFSLLMNIVNIFVNAPSSAQCPLVISAAPYIIISFLLSLWNSHVYIFLLFSIYSYSLSLMLVSFCCLRLVHCSFLLFSSTSSFHCHGAFEFSVTVTFFLHFTFLLFFFSVCCSVIFFSVAFEYLFFFFPFLSHRCFETWSIFIFLSSSVLIFRSIVSFCSLQQVFCFFFVQTGVAVSVFDPLLLFKVLLILLSSTYSCSFPFFYTVTRLTTQYQHNFFIFECLRLFNIQCWVFFMPLSSVYFFLTGTPIVASLSSLRICGTVRSFLFIFRSIVSCCYYRVSASCPYHRRTFSFDIVLPRLRVTWHKLVFTGRSVVPFASFICIFFSISSYFLGTHLFVSQLVSTRNNFFI